MPFTDGAVREVFEEADGRQYVMDGRERVYGLWVVPDEPAVADGLQKGETQPLAGRDRRPPEPHGPGRRPT